MNRVQLPREKLIEACENLNTKIIEPHLNDQDFLFGKSKWEFLWHLHVLFQKADKLEILKLVMVSRWCQKCHPGKEILEFYPLDKVPEYYRHLPRRKNFTDLKPVFAFAVTIDNENKFDIEPCENSWGFQPGGLYEDWREVGKKIHGDFG